MHLFHLRQRYRDMLEACRIASAIQYVVVAPSAPGVVLPEHLRDEELVRLNLVAGRDTPSVLLDEHGIKATLTFSGRRFDCAIPWVAVVAGVLDPPRKQRPRFGVIAGGKKD